MRIRRWMLWAAAPLALLSLAALSVACGPTASGEPSVGGDVVTTAAGAAATAAAREGAPASESSSQDEGAGAEDGSPGSSRVAASAAAAGNSAPAPADGMHHVAPAAATGGTPQKEFPPADYLQRIVVAYRIAASNPELLEGLPCYCPCELYGHGGVLDCYRSQHAAMCATCLDIGVAAGQLYESQGGQADMEAVRQAVKDRYRRAVAAQILQELPMNQLAGARAYAQVCSDCHQPPSPAMHSAADWGGSLQRMEAYARQSGRMPSEQLWGSALQYVRSIAARYPQDVTDKVRADLQDTVERLKVDEGDSAYYPSARNEVLDPAWAERVAEAYRLANSLPADLLAVTPTRSSTCAPYGHSTLLECLNSWHAITCEESVDQVYELTAAQ